MYTTTDEKGILNNYATEVPTYYAEYPSPEQQRRYAIQGAVAFILVSVLIVTAFGIS